MTDFNWLCNDVNGLLFFFKWNILATKCRVRTYRKYVVENVLFLFTAPKVFLWPKPHRQVCATLMKNWVQFESVERCSEDVFMEEIWVVVDISCLVAVLAFQLCLHLWWGRKLCELDFFQIPLFRGTKGQFCGHKIKSSLGLNCNVSSVS